MISVNYSQAVVAADGILVIDDHPGIREVLTDVFTYRSAAPPLSAQARGLTGIFLQMQALR